MSHEPSLMALAPTSLLKMFALDSESPGWERWAKGTTDTIPSLLTSIG